MNPIGFVPDLMEESRIFEWGGVGFGEIETYRIMKSLKVRPSPHPYRNWHWRPVLLRSGSLERSMGLRRTTT